MKIAHLSVVSILGCLLGLALLVIYAGISFQELRHRQQDVTELLELQQSVSAFSATTDGMLLYRSAPDRRDAYLAEAVEIRARLLSAGTEHPDIRNAAGSIRRMVALVESIPEQGDAVPSAGAGTGALAMPARSRQVMARMATNHDAINTALGDALMERRTDIAGATRHMALQLSLAGVLFGVICVIAFALVHRRITRPVLVLARTIGRLRSGDRGVRAPVGGDDEITELAQSFNHLVDELQTRENSLLKLKDRSERAERVASLGSWEVDYDSGQLSWSPGVFVIFGMNPEEFGASEAAFLERIHPGDQDWFARRRAAWLAGPDPEFDAEHRIVRPDGSVRWVREIARIFYRADGSPNYSTGTVQDITDRKAREREVGVLSGRLRRMLESIAEGVLVLDHNLCHQFSNATAAVLLGEDLASLRQYPLKAMSRGLGDSARRLLQHAVDDAEPASGEHFHAGTGRWLEVRVYPGNEEVALFIRDVSRNREATDEVNRTLALRKALINALPAHIVLVDGDGTIIDVNEQWRHYGRKNSYMGEGFGLSSNYLEICDAARGDCEEDAFKVAAGLREVLAGGRELFAREYACHSPDEEQWFRVMASRLDPDGEGGLAGAVVMHVDITERKLAERELEKLAFYDSLTGLLTRHGFERELNGRFESGWQPRAMVVLLDIVGQRDINDTFGYATGDRVLVEIGRRLRECSDGTAVVCRLGGDEFALFVPAEDGVSPDERRRNISQVFSPRLDIEDHAIAVTARCGYTVLGQSPRSVDALLAEAELALFRSPDAENFHDMPWSLYSSRFDAQLRIREDLIQELRQATEDGAFELHFQPKVRLSDGMLIAGEALIRWPHPRLGLQSPGVFVPLAEQSQLIAPMGDWVLYEACRLLRDWQRQGLDIVRIAVNVSIQQFLVGDIVATVQAALAENGLMPSALSLEVTESVFSGESDALYGKLVQLHDMGVRLSLDDFGTGYSSLLYLQKYPFDEIKIDRAFVSRVLTDDYCRHVVHTVVDLAAVLNADVVAEGIESRDIGEALHALGCGIGQGFYYSMPLEAEDFRWLLERRGALPLSASGHEHQGLLS